MRVHPVDYCLPVCALVNEDTSLRRTRWQNSSRPVLFEQVICLSDLSSKHFSGCAAMCNQRRCVAPADPAFRARSSPYIIDVATRVDYSNGQYRLDDLIAFFNLLPTPFARTCKLSVCEARLMAFVQTSIDAN